MKRDRQIASFQREIEADRRSKIWKEDERKAEKEKLETQIMEIQLASKIQKEENERNMKAAMHKITLAVGKFNDENKQNKILKDEFNNVKLDLASTFEELEGYNARSKEVLCGDGATDIELLHLEVKQLKAANATARTNMEIQEDEITKAVRDAVSEIKEKFTEACKVKDKEILSLTFEKLNLMAHLQEADSDISGSRQHAEHLAVELQRAKAVEFSLKEEVERQKKC